jgi:mycothiol system anti-sigma-R factor
MTCERVTERLSGFLDGELSPEEIREIREHLADCTDCSKSLESLRALQSAIREHAPRHTAPSRLRNRILDDTSSKSKRWPWTVFGLGSLAGATLTVLAILLLAPRPNDGLASALVDDQVRSLEQGHLLDVVSTDRHTVKPWFNGKLDFAPTVLDLAPEGFPLVGGRLEYLDGHAAAALVYKRRQHTINVIVIPMNREPALPSELRGFHFAEWRVGDLQYLAVSDVDSSDLASLRSIYLRIAR